MNSIFLCCLGKESTPFRYAIKRPEMVKKLKMPNSKNNNFPLFKRITLLVLPTLICGFAAQAAPEQARPADAFVETIGLGGRYDWMFGGGQLGDAKSVLQKTKIRYIRGGVLGEGVDQVAYSAAMRKMLTDLNVKMCGLVSWESPDESIAAVRRLGPALYALEGVNESWDRPDWGWKGWNTALDVQKFIYGLGRSRNLDVYSWTLGGPINAYVMEEFTDGYRQTDAFSTHANFHPYHWYSNPDGRGTTKIIGLWQDAETPDKKGAVETVRRVMQNPKKRLVATEWGWSNAPKEGDPFWVPEAARAKFYARGMLESFNAGLERSFLYSINSHLNYNIREGAKLLPTGQAVADLIALTEDRGAAFQAGPLDYSLSVDSGMRVGDDRDLRNDEIHHTLLQKRDGRFLLILWADKDSHLNDTKSENATLTLPKGAAQVRLFKPVSNGTKAVSTLGAVAAGGTVRLTGAVAIPDHPLIIELTPHSHKK